MPSMSAITRSDGSETQPSCFCTSHKSGITADCLRASGYLAIHHSALFSVSLLKANEAGWSLARRLTLI